VVLPVKRTPQAMRMPQQIVLTVLGEALSKPVTQPRVLIKSTRSYSRAARIAVMPRAIAKAFFSLVMV